MVYMQLNLSDMIMECESVMMPQGFGRGVNLSKHPSLGKSVAMILFTNPMSTHRSPRETQDALDFIALRREMVLPVGEHTGSGKDESHAQLCILDTDAFVRATTKHEIVLRVGISRAIGIEPPFGNQAVMVGVHFGVVQGVVKGRDHHAADRDRVIRSDREWLRGPVRNLEQRNCQVRAHRNE
jgi:hypothetical protein